MTHDLLVNLIASAIAFAAGFAIRTSRHRIKSVLSARSRRVNIIRRHPGYAQEWIVNYYARRGRIDDLYSFHNDGQRVSIPFLVKPRWYGREFSEEQLILQSVPHALSDASVAKSVLDRRKEYLTDPSGGEVWDDLHACVARVIDSPEPQVEIVLARYFQYMSACGALEDETYRAVTSRRRMVRTPLRDRVLPDVNAACDCQLRAHALGMTVAMIFRHSGLLKVIIHERSHAVSTYGGALGVVPMFSCQTTDLSSETTVSLKHNLLREIFEELYGGVSVEQIGMHAAPDWFYSHPAIARILKSIDGHEYVWNILGFGFDALNGQVIIGGSIYIESLDFAEIELPHLVGNWEMKRIYVWDLFGSDLTDALVRSEFTPACAFTLAEARRRYGARNED